MAATAAGLAGDDDEVERFGRRAEYLAPNDPDKPTDLALLYLETDRVGAARAAIERALALDPDDERARQVADRIDESA